MCATRGPRGYERHFHRVTVTTNTCPGCPPFVLTCERRLETPPCLSKLPANTLLAAIDFNYEQCRQSRYHCACVQQDLVPTKTVFENANIGGHGRKREETSSAHPHRGYPVQGGMFSALFRWSLRAVGSFAHGDLCRTPRYDTESGKSCSGLMTSPPKHSLNMLREDLAK